MSPEWQKLQPGYGLGSEMIVSTHSLSITRKLISNNLRLTNYDTNLSERISSLEIVTYDANHSNFYQKNYDANLKT